MYAKVLLLYGSGAGVGASILKKFSANGWKTAAVVRTLKDEYKKSADIVVQADFADPKAIQKVYSDVESQLGTPSCVVYNAYSATAATKDTKIFTASPEQFAKDITVNTVGSFTAAHSAAGGFARLSSGPKTFIFTGNALPTINVPELQGIGAGKAGAAYFIESAANALKDDSHWYFADERTPKGRPVANGVDADAHAEAYYELATSDKQEPWNYTFVKGQGYKRFDDVVDHEYATFSKLLEQTK